MSLYAARIQISLRDLRKNEVAAFALCEDPYFEISHFNQSTKNNEIFHTSKPLRPKQTNTNNLIFPAFDIQVPKHAMLKTWSIKFKDEHVSEIGDELYIDFQAKFPFKSKSYPLNKNCHLMIDTCYLTVPLWLKVEDFGDLEEIFTTFDDIYFAVSYGGSGKHILYQSDKADNCPFLMEWGEFRLKWSTHEAMTYGVLVTFFEKSKTDFKKKSEFDLKVKIDFPFQEKMYNIGSDGELSGSGVDSGARLVVRNNNCEACKLEKLKPARHQFPTYNEGDGEVRVRKREVKLTEMGKTGKPVAVSNYSDVIPEGDESAVVFFKQ